MSDVRIVFSLNELLFKIHYFVKLWALMGGQFELFFKKIYSFCKCHVFMNLKLYICIFSVDVVISDGKKTEVERRLRL